LTGCLHTLHAMLTATVQNGDPEPGLRLTVHVPCNNGHQLQQLVDYVGHRRTDKPTAGRKFKMECGIVGRAYREGRVYFACRENNDYEKYIKELTTAWSYIESDARKLHPASKSWMAFPLCMENGEPAAAVVFADSIEPNFFDNKTRREIIENACQGIARFVKSSS